MWSRVALVMFAMLAVVLTDPTAVLWGHGGGMLAGALAAAVLSPSAPWAKPARLVAFAIAGAFVAAFAAAAIFAARTSLAQSFGPPIHTASVGDVALRVPASFSGGAFLDGPGIEGYFAV